MIKIEILILSNNSILPFQNLHSEYGLNFVELNKLFATQSLAEHGLGYLINLYETNDDKDEWDAQVIKKYVFDTGSTNQTYLHNLDLRGYNLIDLDAIILSHWHYDHTGSFYDILERSKREISIICHESSKFERIFKRSEQVIDKDLRGKMRNEIESLILESKVVNQLPIELERVKKLNGKIVFSRHSVELLNKDSTKITVSGEIPRTHVEERFDDFFYLYDDKLIRDDILDDKCLIFESKDSAVLLLGCCHSGIMNTLDYVKSITTKPITHIVGGFHMANASQQRINRTIDYLRTFQESEGKLYLFPIHCSGEKFLYELLRKNDPYLQTYNASVGTMFKFE